MTAPPKTDLRVVFVNDVAFIVKSLSSELTTRGVIHEVIGRRSGETEGQPGSFAENLITIEQGLLRTDDFDILHVNYGLFGLFGFQTRRPVVLHVHGSDIRRGTGSSALAANTLTRLGLLRADRVWYSTTELGPRVRYFREDSRFMPNPVDGRFFTMANHRPRARHVLFAVPLSRLKGADLGIRAMNRLVRQDPEIRVSTFDFGPNPAECALLSGEIPPTVTRVGWARHEDMPQLLSSADVVVGRLRIGSLGVTELEAMATGRPLVSQIPDSLAKLEPYYREEPPIASCWTEEQVVESILALLDDHTKAQTLAERGRDWTARYHSAAAVAAQYYGEYTRLLRLPEAAA